MRNRFFIGALFFFLYFMVTAPTARAGACIDETLVSHGSVVLGGAVQPAYALAPNTLLVPASVLKIATSLAALHLLGSSWRFTTEFFLDETTLYIRGQGDPFLVSEEVDVVFARLGRMGVTVVNDIVVDDSAFAPDTASPAGAGETLNPYDAGNGALVVNFNTIEVEVTHDSIHSAEPQTPTLPLMEELGRGLQPGIHRINVSVGDAAKERALRYAAELFRAMQHKHGIRGSGSFRCGRVPGGLPLLYAHRSGKTLDQVVRALLLYSNNFIANQLFLAMGMKHFGGPATWDKGKRAMLEAVRHTAGLTKDELVLEEGSGLSRKNRTTAGALIKILEAFRPWFFLLPREPGAWIKSGTLTGVFSYAGYFGDTQSLTPFVVLLNQEKNSRDRILKQLRTCLGAQAAPQQ